MKRMERNNLPKKTYWPDFNRPIPRRPFSKRKTTVKSITFVRDWDIEQSHNASRSSLAGVLERSLEEGSEGSSDQQKSILQQFVTSPGPYVIASKSPVPCFLTAHNEVEDEKSEEDEENEFIPETQQSRHGSIEFDEGNDDDAVPDSCVGSSNAVSPRVSPLKTLDSSRIHRSFSAKTGEDNISVQLKNVTIRSASGSILTTDKRRRGKLDSPSKSFLDHSESEGGKSTVSSPKSTRREVLKDDDNHSHLSNCSHLSKGSCTRSRRSEGTVSTRSIRSQRCITPKMKSKPKHSAAESEPQNRSSKALSPMSDIEEDNSDSEMSGQESDKSGSGITVRSNKSTRTKSPSLSTSLANDLQTHLSVRLKERTENLSSTGEMASHNRGSVKGSRKRQASSPLSRQPRKRSSIRKSISETPEETVAPAGADLPSTAESDAFGLVSVQSEGEPVTQKKTMVPRQQVPKASREEHSSSKEGFSLRLWKGDHNNRAVSTVMDLDVILNHFEELAWTFREEEESHLVRKQISLAAKAIQQDLRDMISEAIDVKKKIQMLSRTENKLKRIRKRLLSAHRELAVLQNDTAKYQSLLKRI